MCGGSAIFWSRRLRALASMVSRILRRGGSGTDPCEYPIGEPFLNGPARLSADELRALQERRFAALMRRGWEIPFYRRHWGSVGIEPGDVKGYR